ncbi:hypothetical protein HBA55_32685 [Pseudomaricurvus alkylphenolicus]|uniref:DUF6701 domain-containing protein n=1 Tax=Pseudomaricurvus alkylphenolicus TaxID=1306991 RepID=UPI00141E4170|nr:DUF6701 domain-containing protein [Pseudomaricurvus alkylphenolicus]NIB44397.1 hypothetical protein [Pseudomaricurvus alkylphenolicus]
MFLAAVMSGSALAVDCDDIFSGGLQNHTGAGTIDVDNNAEINGGGTQLDTGNLQGGTGACDGSNCSASGSPASGSSPPFQTGDGSDGDISVGNNQSETVGDSGDFQFQAVSTGNNNSTLTFSSDQSVYYFQNGWDVKGTITLAPGDYWIEEGVVFNNGTSVVVSPAGTVRFYARQSILFSQGVSINNPGASSQLLIFSEQNITLDQTATVNAYLYAEGNVTANQNATVNGSISAGGDIAIEENATINYEDPDSGDYGDFCEVTPDSSLVDYGVYPVTPTVTCEPGTVVIQPHDSNHNAIANDGVTITLTTSPANNGWTKISGNGILSGNQYTFSGGETSVTLGLVRTTPGTLDIDVTDGSASDPDGDAIEDQDIVFADTAFRFYGNGTVDNIGTQIAGKDSDVMPGNQTLTVRAIGTDTNTGECTALTSGGNVNIGFAYTCVNPGSCATTTDGMAINGTRTIDQMASGYNDISINFDGTGTGTFDLNYYDAGRIRLNASAVLQVDGNNVTVQGSSNDFVVRPSGFCVVSGDTNADCAVQNHTCSEFKRAGDSFNLTLSARIWGDSSDANTDFCNNAITPNFVQSGLTLGHSLIAPGGGSSGAISNTDADINTGGTVTVVQSVDEVGVFNFSVGPLNNYLSTSDADISVSSSDAIGRFVPGQFIIENGSVSAANMVFSYFDQPFTVNYDIQAQSTTGEDTENYRDQFVMLEADELSYDALIGSVGPQVFDETRIRIDTTDLDWSGNAGLGQIEVQMVIERDSVLNNLPEAPLSEVRIGAFAEDTEGSLTITTANLDMDTDLDSTDDHVELGDLDLRFARLFIQDVWGPEDAALAIPLQVEYWSGSSWVLSAGDETQLQRTDIVLTPSVGAGADISADPITAPVGTNPAVGFTYDPTGNATIDFGDGMGNGTGSAGMTVGAPTSTGFFTIDIDLSDEPWLQFDWDQDGDYNDADDRNTPTATIRFETYRGHDRVIYWREVID